jgi:UDP-3-O-[3-hydroxymyristoyl] glucosamine N-acyltransferase
VAENETKSLSLGEIAQFAGALVKGDPEIRVVGVAPIETAGPDQLSFFTDARYRPLLEKCTAAALIVPPSFTDLEFPLLVCDRPYLAAVRVAKLFFESAAPSAGIDPAAHIEPGAEIGAHAWVGPLAHIGSGSRIGEGTCVHGTAYIGRNVSVGENCTVYPGAVILDGSRIGRRVIVHSGAVIGADGFGYVQDEAGRHEKIPQIGIVEIEDDVEIGANATIDRATFGRTLIRRGAKIDNLVMIAHNVEIGEDCIMAAQAGISGSSRLGSHVSLGGQVGIAGHLEIGDRVRLGAKSGVHASIRSDQDMAGIPAVPQGEWVKSYANIRRLSRMREELRQLKDRVQKIEEALNEP